MVMEGGDCPHLSPFSMSTRTFDSPKGSSRFIFIIIWSNEYIGLGSSCMDICTTWAILIFFPSQVRGRVIYHSHFLYT